MNKLELPDNALTEAVKAVDNHVGQTYDNLTYPITKSAGTLIGSIVDLVFSPFRYFDAKSNEFFQHKLRMYKKQLEEKEKSIPTAKKTDPDFHIVSLALDNSKFCITNDELREMFVNLIGNTMNSDMKDIAHPAFAEIIKQMTSIDAIILKTFTIKSSQPIAEIRHSDENRTYEVIYRNYFIAQLIDNPFSSEACSVSVTNLERLGLVNIFYDAFLSDSSLYDNYNNVLECEFKGHELHKGIVALTQVGQAFIKVCFD